MEFFIGVFYFGRVNGLSWVGVGGVNNLFYLNFHFCP